MSTRRGSVTLEAILTLPIVFIATIAIFQFGISMVVLQAATSAANDGVRVAAKGGDADDVKDAVDHVLSSVSLQIGANASLRREDSTTSVTRGSLACPEPMAPTLSSDEVRVSVCVNMTAAPLLNALAPFGLSFSGKTLEVRAHATEEN